MSDFMRKMECLILDQMTSNSPPPEPTGSFSIAHIQYLRATMQLKPAPPPVRIVESILMVDDVFDWSKARSPSRTKRRMRYNRSRIVSSVPEKDGYLFADGSFVCHPIVAQQIRAALPPEST